MSEIQVAMLLIGLLLVLILMRVPIAIALIAVSFIGIGDALNWRIAWGTLGLVPYQFSSSWMLSSVPAFLFMGFICYHTRLTQGLFDAARVWLSALPGGLAVASILGCSGFAAVCGSSVACAAAMGKVAVPEMVSRRYSAELATGAVAAGGTIGALIPPSVILIIYGIIAEVPIRQLFIGGFWIGIFTMFSYITLIIVRVKLNPSLAPTFTAELQPGDRLRSVVETWPIAAVAIVVLGGLFTGFFTATEAGSIGAVMSCVVALAKRTLTFAALKRSAIETLVTTGSLLIIAIGASMLARYLALSGTGAIIAGLVEGITPFQVILIAMVIYLVLGLILEPMGSMLLTLPILIPIVDNVGISLVWFGLFAAKLLEVGLITPPVGMNVFVIKSVVGNLLPTSAIFRGVAPFILADGVVLGLMIWILYYFPAFLG